MGSSPAPGSKTLIQSKTFWWAVLTAAAGATGALQTNHIMDPNTALVVAGIVSALLRLVTKQPVTLN